MEKLFPIVFNESQKIMLEQKIQEMGALNYQLTTIRDNTELYMIVPGITNPQIYFNNGGSSDSQWREINEPIMEIIFEILGININNYYEELKKILRISILHNIYLIDVEFILCSILEPDESGELIKKNKIVMIDFDKVKFGASLDKKTYIDLTLKQDMFPGTFQHIFQESATASASAHVKSDDEDEHLTARGGNRTKKTKRQKNKKTKKQRTKKQRTKKQRTKKQRIKNKGQKNK